MSKWGPGPNEPDLAKFRLGHAAGLAPPTEAPWGRITNIAVNGQKSGCGGAAARKAKMIEMQNKFRGMLGLPLVGAETPDALVHIAAPPAPNPGFVHILPFPGPPSGTGLLEDPIRYESLDRTETPFIERLQRSLAMLGTWEGRAVAFVLGCGLGVLIRMFWVFALLFIRASRGIAESRDAPSTTDEDDFIAHDVIFVATDRDGHFVDHYPDEKIEAVKGGA